MRNYMKIFTTGCVLSASILCADSAHKPSHLEELDPDLFRKDKAVFFASAEFLFWAPSEGALDYAVKMNQPAWSSIEDTYAVGHYHNASFDWSSGLRVAFGHFNAPHFWDIFAQYTYVPSTGSNSVFAPHESDEFLNGTWVQPDMNLGAPIPAPLHKAHSHISLQYHVLDLLFSRRFIPNPHFRFNFFGGITSAFLYQKWKVFYEDVNDLHAKIRNRWQFEGVGFRLGTKMDWFLGHDIYLTGMASTGALAGWYKNTAFQKTNLQIAGANNSRPVHNTQLHDTRLTYTVQFQTGLSWQRIWSQIRTDLFAGYEFNIWTNLHQIYRSALTPPTAGKDTYINSSNLSLQGLTTRFTVDF